MSRLPTLEELQRPDQDPLGAIKYHIECAVREQVRATVTVPLPVTLTNGELNMLIAWAQQSNWTLSERDGVLILKYKQGFPSV